MINSPFFTIIIPVYNRAELVSKSIESVLEQDYTDFELILIDDGSTDDSVGILKNFREKDNRIKLILLDKNMGRCYARNEGVRNASGSWICYLDSDDLHYTNHLSSFSELIAQYPDYNAFAVDQHVNSKLKRYRNSNLHKDNCTLIIENFIEDNPLTANQICYSNEIKIEWSQERISISEDWLFMRTLALKTPIFKKAIITTNLRDHNDRSMNTTGTEQFVHYNLLAADKFIAENEVPNAIKKRIISYTLLLCTNVFLSAKLKRKAMPLFLKSLRYPRTFSYLLFYKAIVKFVK